MWKTNQGTVRFAVRVSKLMATVHPHRFGMRISRKIRLWRYLHIFGFLVFIPLFVEKRSRFARYHVKQGMILLAVELLFAICYCVLSFVMLSISWHLYYIVKIAGMVRYLFPVLAVIGILNAINGKAKELPVIGGIL